MQMRQIYSHFVLAIIQMCPQTGIERTLSQQPQKKCTGRFSPTFWSQHLINKEPCFLCVSEWRSLVQWILMICWHWSVALAPCWKEAHLRWRSFPWCTRASERVMTLTLRELRTWLKARWTETPQPQVPFHGWQVLTAGRWEGAVTLTSHRTEDRVCVWKNQRSLPDSTSF